jgi:gliding motility-associated-like protein
MKNTTVGGLINKLFLFLPVFVGFSLKAQLWVNEGQLFYSEQRLQMRVEGSFMNDSGAVSFHNGLLVIDSSFINRGASTQRGNGEFDVYGNWLNSARFIRDTSSVYLKGLTEYIEGDSSTDFYNLSAEGLGSKVMRTNASVYGHLNLNSLELATNEDTLFIQNSDPSAVTASIVFGREGFVSTLDRGCLVRKTNSMNGYYYPLGSVTGTRRFRPVNVSPNANTINTYGVSFQNKTADSNGYFTANRDTNVCKVNQRFYHTLNRITGTSAADILISYLKAEDGNWTEIGNWQPGENKWINTNNGVDAGINKYDGVKRPNWNNFSSKPYALLNYEPIIDSIGGPDLICKQLPVSYMAYVNYSDACEYFWNSSGGSFTSDSTREKSSLLFSGAGNKTIYLTVVDTATGCSSSMFAKHISVLNGPKAGFTLSYPNLFLNTPISFMDSSHGADTWYWSFGNGYTSDIENPLTAYSNGGSYSVKQVVTDVNGCKDSADITLVIDCHLQMPNVFTPNGDGVNDVFFIESSCITHYTLEISDRWGILVYKGSQVSPAWDGHTPSGQECPAGTYYYLLYTNEGNDEQQSKGFITLLR